ncbi:hypothetical protein [Enterococcus termitis]|nr:hypothetical protein [Enterococcus termitis]OJG97478.1 hypothetical protein RV18_GL000759 [Enterococcus termitis]
MGIGTSVRKLVVGNRMIKGEPVMPNVVTPIIPGVDPVTPSNHQLH